MSTKRRNCCLPSEKKFTSLFRSLGDSHRMGILSFLCACHASGKEACTVSEVAKCCEVDLSGVSRHLNTLKDGGVISAEKVGKEVRYSLNGKSLAKALRDLADFIESCSSCSSNTKTKD